MKRGKYRRLNASLCPDCQRLVVSYANVHDYVTCRCPNQTMADGGFAYDRYGGVKMPLRPEIWEKLK